MRKGEKKDQRVRAEEKCKALVGTAADRIFTVDLLGSFTFVNSPAETMSGSTEEGLVGRHFRELVPGKCIPICLDVFQRPLRALVFPEGGE